MFRLADKGTIFLTEIGDLFLPLQVKLLSVLDDREFYQVGGSNFDSYSDDCFFIAGEN